MDKEEFNKYVRKLWNANHSDEIAKILKSFENKVTKDNKPPNTDHMLDGCYH